MAGLKQIGDASEILANSREIQIQTKILYAQVLSKYGKTDEQKEEGCHTMNELKQESEEINFLLGFKIIENLHNC